MRVLSLVAVLAAVPLMTTAAQAALEPADTPLARLHTLCIADAGGGGAAPTLPPIGKVGLLSGFGTGGFAVRTADKDAQAWFNHGMRLAHAFNHAEATAAFQEAQKHDPVCAMCVWGEAWSRGPTINFGISASDMKEAAALADKAVVLAKDGPEKERLLAAALQQRYADPKVKGVGDLGFAKAMDALAKRYPDDSEIAVMAADAWLIRSSLWSDNSGLQRAMSLLEGVLKGSPSDTAAIHFYIHATEMAGVAAKAEPYADHLAELAPGAGHLVHMPSHTFYQVGRYEDAAIANVRAVEVDNAHQVKIGAPPDSFRRSYHAHNVHFGIGGAMMSGDSASAMALADTFLAVQKTIKPDEGWLQLSSSSGYYAYGRYGANAAAAPAPPKDLPLAQVLWHYARGEAFVRSGDLKSAGTELAAMDTPRGAFKPMGGTADTASIVAEVARQVLTGRIAIRAGNLRSAEGAFRRATALQAKLGVAGDPPIWWYPVRRSIAATLIAEGRNDDAIKEATASLASAPNDPVALKLRAEAERKLGKTAEAERDLAQARKAWKGDVKSIDLLGA
jgi:tetratricopeptide (TPR) repeat protein